MSPFSIFIIAVAVMACILGFRRGLIAQAGQIIALVGGILACRILAPHVVAWFSESAPDDTANTAICYALTFLVAYGVVLLVAHLLRGAVGAVHLGFIDRLAGAAFKTGVWMLILSVLLNVWAAIMPGSDLTDTTAHPERAHIIRIAPAVCGYVMEQAAKNSHCK